MDDGGDRKMKKSHIVMLPIFLLLIPATIYFGLRFSGRAYYVTTVSYTHLTLPTTVLV